MAAKSHTPGPWTADAHDRGLSFVLMAEEGELVPSIAVGNPADARLIAAAPDLLECVRIAETYLMDAVLTDPDDLTNAAADLHMLRAAWAKAEGRA